MDTGLADAVASYTARVRSFQREITLQERERLEIEQQIDKLRKDLTTIDATISRHKGGLEFVEREFVNALAKTEGHEQPAQEPQELPPAPTHTIPYTVCSCGETKEYSEDFQGFLCPRCDQEWRDGEAPRDAPEGEVAGVPLEIDEAPSAAPARRQTWNQWCSSLRASYGLDVSGADSRRQAHFKAAYDAGKRPREAWEEYLHAEASED